MARKKSLFDDRPEEIQQLTLIIKQDICSLNKQIAQLQQVGFFIMFQLFVFHRIIGQFIIRLLRADIGHHKLKRSSSGLLNMLDLLVSC